jgi:hypothetical protein
LISREVGWIPKGGILWTIGIALSPYVAIMIGAAVINAVRAPVKLDNHRARRAALLRESAAQRTEAAKAKLVEAVPDDQKEKRRIVAEKLRDFSAGEREFLLWHAHHGRVRDAEYSQSGVSGWQSAIAKCRQRGLVLDEPRVIGPHFTSINQEFKEAILYSCRPVTPPSA